jgi:23S rRNA (uracil1939-C5)-methyltransferase
MFHEYSKLRVEPFCPHFGVCGGCQWQMLPYQQQLEYKQDQVEQTLRRIGKVDLPQLLPIIGARETRFYRNKLEYTFSNRRFLLESELSDQKISSEEDVAGFHAKGIYDKVIDIRTCFLQPEPSNGLRIAVKDFAKSNGYSFYDIKNHKGFLRTMQVRIGTTGEVMVNVVFAFDDQKKIKSLLDFILEKFPGITTLLYTINSKWNDSLNDLEPVCYFGKGFIIEKMSAGESEEDFQFKIGPTSFFQTNTTQAEQLYEITRQFAELTGNEIVYDLYCGTGSIGIFLSRQAKKIVGVEMIEAAVNDARENAELNQAHSAEFFTGDVIDICNDEFFLHHGKAGVIVTDPPRAGMHTKLVQKIIDIAAPVVVYVSCNPATQARDLNLLGERYEVTKIQPVDMFPHTHHIENVAQLKLR